MGREHRLSRNPRLREEGDRRPAGVSAALRKRVVPFRIRARQPIAGIDVGEDFLDLAILDEARSIRLCRVEISSCEKNPIAEIAKRIAATAPELGRGAIALVDSPRTPRFAESRSDSRERDLDSMLRDTVTRLNRARGENDQVKLAMFPTPPPEYFLRCAADSRCKPHLAAIAREIVGEAKRYHGRNGGRGWLFTRFMLAGFAVHSALELLGVRSVEAYPYLAFTLWKTADEALPPKSKSRDALMARRKIIERLAHTARLEVPPTRTLDEVDATVLAITAAIGRNPPHSNLILRSPTHGDFLLPCPGRGFSIAAASLSLSAGKG